MKITIDAHGKPGDPQILARLGRFSGHVIIPPNDLKLTDNIKPHCPATPPRRTIFANPHRLPVAGATNVPCHASK
ncbi:MAG TPA: hypothetical protein VHX86_11020 [Tepidisphaeraceae bacterium]|nr:hypothetical protein [Tepidisphaeraceae bacterium]